MIYFNHKELKNNENKSDVKSNSSELKNNSSELQNNEKIKKEIGWIWGFNPEEEKNKNDQNDDEELQFNKNKSNLKQTLESNQKIYLNPYDSDDYIDISNQKFKNSEINQDPLFFDSK